MSAENDDSRPLSNSDFRKLLETPRVVHKHQEREVPQTPVQDDEKKPVFSTKDKKKSRHKFKPSNKDKAKSNMEFPNQKYRDRAKERRDGHIVGEDGETIVSSAALQGDVGGDYKAVGPIAGPTLAEKRRQLIQESKYLGGDMEHTHLVKGLDYVLLQKVRQEIQTKEEECDDILDEELAKTDVKTQQNQKIEKPKNPMAVKVEQVLFGSKPLKRNEYFVPGRMAYRVELEDELGDSYVPTTIIRSKMDILNQGFSLTNETASTNEIIITKLTQILSYLREGKRQSKKSKTIKKIVDSMENVPELVTEEKTNSLSIYDDVPSVYIPTMSKKVRDSSNLDDMKSSRDEKSRGKKGKYFDKIEDNLAESLKPTTAKIKEISSMVAMENPLKESQGAGKANDKVNLDKLLKKSQVSGYDECYPGFAESFDAMGDSDDETDLLKMDVGTKKGPIGRWDFDTNEEYSEYMSSKEALPKAAFQYGQKMNDGRKTRRLANKDEKQHLDKQWNKIQSIISKRRGDGGDGPSNKSIKL